MAFRNIIICLVLTVTVLAFPIRIFDLSPFILFFLKFCKGMMFICILFLLNRKDNLGIRLTAFNHQLVWKNIFLALGLLFVYLAININKILYSDFSNTGVIVIVLFATFTLAFAEEIAFRAYIQLNLIKLAFPKHRCIIISSALFACMHCINIFRLGGDVFSVINQIAFAFFMGVLLGSLYFITKSLLFISLYHFFVNLPGALDNLKTDRLPVEQVSNKQSFSEDLFTTLLFVLLISPLIIVSIYYLRKIERDENFKKGASHINNPTNNY